MGTPHRTLRESGVSRMPRPMKIPGGGRGRQTTRLLRRTDYIRGLSPARVERPRHASLSTAADVLLSALCGWSCSGPASEFSGVVPGVAVTVTTTPSGSGGIELEHMEHAVDPSRCATNEPRDHCSGSVPPDHDGGPKPLTCANTAWRHRARTDDLRIQNQQTACPLTMWHKMCHIACLRDGSVGHEGRS